MGSTKGSKNKPKNVVVVDIPKTDYFVVASDLGDGDVPSAPAPVQKKRGRPKGSKNKPKGFSTPIPVEPQSDMEEGSSDIPIVNTFGRQIKRYDIGRKHNPGMDIVTCPVCGRNGLRQEVFSLNGDSSRVEYLHVVEKAAMFNQYIDFCDDRGPHVCQ